MWSTISRLFVAKPRPSSAKSSLEESSNSLSSEAQASLAVHVFESMDRNMGDDRRRDSEQLPPPTADAYETRQAKQRASVKWLLSKAFNNRVPDNLHEPYYRDHEDQEHLKPQIVHSLSNAELYCLALANIYSDPNYHNQNHGGILQALGRKGVFVAEPNNLSLTETTLIQNSPLKMSAHMAVIEGLMVLYAKEVVTSDRVVAAIRRFNPQAVLDTPSDHETGLLLWISHASEALVAKIQQQTTATATEEDKTKRLPELPDTKDFHSLCDGVGLAAVVAFYCPNELNWMDIKVSKRPSVADALHNLSLVHAFCMRCLPYSIFHMQPEDVTYMRGSMKQNLVVFLADMYNVLEIHPVKCVRYPGEERAMQYLDVGKSLSAPISVRKSQSLHQTAESYSYEEKRGGVSEESFVIHRNKGIPTLSNVATAGRPSNWEDQRRSSYAGRRSRRNSVTDDSQLTIENFGGSQDNLQNFGCMRNPDKEMVHSGKRLVAEPTLPARSMLQDVYGSDVQNILADNGYNNDSNDHPRLRRQTSNASLNNSSAPIKNILHSTCTDNHDADTDDNNDYKKMASFANLAKQNIDKASNFKFMEQQQQQQSDNKASFLINNNINNNSNKKYGQSNGNGIGGGGGDKKTTFATLPNTTTWQQTVESHQQSHQNLTDENGGSGSGGGNGGVMASQLNNIRMKLEEKRRHIENEKRKMEVVMSKQRQKIGKTAFLQAVTKEISEDVRDVEHKWLEQDGSSPFIETRRTPDIENMDLEQYQQSISQMNTSLTDIQADIQRLASQQNQIQQQHFMSQHQQQMQQHLQQMQSLSQQQQQQQQHLQNYVVPQTLNNPTLQGPQQQFYLHDQQQQPQIQRRTWARPHQNYSTNDISQQSFMDPRFSPQPVYQQDPRNIYQETRTWGSPSSPGQQHQKGFILHDNLQEAAPRYVNGATVNDHSLHNYPASATQIFNQSSSPSPTTTSSSASPQHRNPIHRISQLMSESPEIKKQSVVHHIPITCENQNQNNTNNNNNNNNTNNNNSNNNRINNATATMHAPVPAPPVDDMEPQNISFIGNSEDSDALSPGLRNLNITSGSRTYRIPSPTKPTPTISRNSFQSKSPSSSSAAAAAAAATVIATTPEIVPFDQSDISEKGFYISFDSDTPKKPKPALRVKRSPKKERIVSSFIEHQDFTARPESPPVNSVERQRHLEAQSDLERERQRQAEEREQQRQEMRDRELQREIAKERNRETRQRIASDTTPGVGLVIGNQLANPDPNSVDEMERKKERIMLLSLQRRQQQEEMKERKEAEIQARRDKEKIKEEERARKKEEDRQRRASILEQHKLKKAIEEAEREGKVIDKEILNALKPTPKLRNKTASARQRPKTIHVDHSSAELDSGTLTPSRGKKGSSSNLSTASLISPTMKRDYFRGSQDTLIAAHCDDHRRSGGPFYRGGSLKVSSVDSPDDGRGCSPCRSSNTQLGRRGSYKTSRDTQEPQQQVRGRTKYPSYQNFKGRKSNSLMNLCDTDSGLGRATPPRRAPSPGMGSSSSSSSKHLPSPSGPGSLPPGLMSKRKFDDGSSDISSTASSMMDYNGPRLYKQPTTKSNRGIMLNAVEYCVFPGTVNKEAKRRVLDEIARSESKHFLILFRDAGCQFRALYSYCPDREEITKLCGTGPKQVLDNMFDRFFKYNSGGKCFSQVHTKHLTVTIDAFTIHNSLWQGKKVNLPNKKDMALVI